MSSKFVDKVLNYLADLDKNINLKNSRVGRGNKCWH